MNTKTAWMYEDVLHILLVYTEVLYTLPLKVDSWQKVANTFTVLSQFVIIISHCSYPHNGMLAYVTFKEYVSKLIKEKRKHGNTKLLYADKDTNDKHDNTKTKIRSKFLISFMYMTH